MNTAQPRPPGVDPARRVAFEVLRAVSEKDAYANLVLPAALRTAGLSGWDAAFATELTYGTLRWRGSYDAVLAGCVDRPLDRLDAPLLDALRLGAHQLLSMRVPAHAAVSQTVALVRSDVGAKVTGLANAVLRRVGGDDMTGWMRRLAPDVHLDPDGHRAVLHSHPRWVVQELASALRADPLRPLDPAVTGSGAEIDALLATHNRAPQVTLVARPGLYDVTRLRRETGALPGRWAPFAAVLPGGDPAELPAVRTGRVGVQDEGSQLAVLALTSAELPGPDRTWLDLCAGPGGKTALLAAAGAGRGARVVAHEVAEHRAELVRKAVAPQRDRVEVRVGDGREIGAAEPAAYDRVLVDAPCTGLGALRRRPEARWRRRPTDVEPLSRLQAELLDSAVEAVRPGGIVGYATCSPLRAETSGVIGELLESRADVELVDAREALAGVPGLRATLSGHRTVQLWPHRHDTDAMFIALLRRR